MQTTTQTALKWGAIAGVIGIVANTITYIFNLDATSSSSRYIPMVLGIVVLILVLIYAMKDFKSGNEGFMKYSQGLGIGSLIGGISGLIAGIYSFIYLKFIDPTHMESIKNFQMQQFEEQGMASEQIEQAMKFTEMFSNPGVLLAFSIIFSVIFYFIASLIVSAVQKHEKPVFE
jgi:disulfide bond formation protein DsbB